MDLPTAADLLKTEAILSAKPDDTVASVADDLRSSHDAVFIVDDEGKFLGVINPFHTFFRQRKPGRGKVKNALFSPPKLSLDTPIDEIARQMVESKVYFLPVVDKKEKLHGIVTIRRIFRELLKNKELLVELPPVAISVEVKTATGEENIGETRDMMANGVSRLPIVDHKGSLIGIITRRDLAEVLADPVESVNFLSRKGQKHELMKRPVKPYIKREVVIARETDSVSTFIYLMHEHEVGSVIITDKGERPQAVVSQSDILRAVAGMDPVKINSTRPL